MKRCSVNRLYTFCMVHCPFLTPPDATLQLGTPFPEGAPHSLVVGWSRCHVIVERTLAWDVRQAGFPGAVLLD